MRTLLAALLLSVLSAGCSTFEGPGPDSLIIKTGSLYKEGIDISAAVKKECRLEETLPEAVQQSARRGYFDEIYLMDKIPPSTPAKVLTMKITGVTSEDRRGFLLGRKALIVEGVLTQQGTVLGSFTDYRVRGGGAMITGYRGTCYLLNSAVKHMGKDIGKWLARPGMDSLLGKAKHLKKHEEASAEPEKEDDSGEDDDSEE